MMEVSQIEAALNAAFELEHVQVKSDGSHFSVIVVGEVFATMSRVKKQQSVYAPLNQWIASGEIHALSIKAFTPEQWKREKMFHSLG